MGSVPSKKTIKGFKKVPRSEHILQTELKNAKKTMALPEQDVFLATQVTETSSEVEKDLAEQKQRVLTAFQHHYDRRGGETPVIVQEAMQGERGVRGEQGPQGVPGPAPNLDSVIREMQTRLEQAEAVRTKARDQELQA